MNQITKVEINLAAGGQFEVAITKAFTGPEDTLTLRESVRSSNIHGALDLAKSMVTVTPGNAAFAESRGWVRPAQ